MSSPTSELKSGLVRAGAGAGKTRGLVDKVVEVYRLFKSRGAEAPRIVLTTFTRKATQELKERLILRACSQKDEELLQFVSDPTKLQITTIHGLLNIFLKQVGHLAGLDSGFQIISESEGEHLARLALREVLVREPSHLRWLEIYGFDRVLEMCRRYQSLKRAQAQLRPAQIVDLEAIAKVQVEVWSEKLTEMCAQIVEGTVDEAWHKYATGITAFTRTWNGNCRQLADLPAKPRRSKKQADLEALHEMVGETLEEFKKVMGKNCWNHELWPAMVSEWSLFHEFAESFSGNLAASKDALGRFEMIDLELKSLEILREKTFLGDVFAESWDFWMIDEYQDTSPLQVEILKLLIGGRKRHVVGDPQQSIYLFRGAEVGVFHAAEVEISEAGGEILELRKNYRSEPELLLWINDFMQSLGPSFQPMEPRNLPAGKSEQVQVVTLWRAPDDGEELKGLVTCVQELLARGARLEEICVLGRTHRHLMEVSRILKDHGYPTHVHSARGFTSRREVLDAQSLWKFLVNPHDNLNFITLLRSPWFFVDDGQLSDWMKDRPQSLWKRLEELTPVPDVLRRLRETIAQMNTIGVVQAFSAAVFSSGMLDLSLVNDPAGRKESNLWKLIHKAQSLETEGGQSILHLIQNEISNPLDVTEGDATSAQEPNSINLMTIHGSKGLEFDHVLIPRMGESPRASHTPPFHADRGVFYFPFWHEEDGEFVSSPLDDQAQRSMREREFQEFDRWLYVAVTRAKKTVTLSWSKVARGSWAERSSWFAKAAGEYRQNGYTYQVLEQCAAPGRYLSSSGGSQEVRGQWSATEAEISTLKKSISDLVVGPVDLILPSARLLGRWQSQNLGVRIHRALENLKYQTVEAQDKIDDEAIQYVLNLEDPPLRQWIHIGSTEWGFHVRTPVGVIEGQIDLWAKYEGKLYVVDYKSGSDAVEFQAAAFRQLSLYSWALRKFGHGEPIVMVIVYPLLKKTISRQFSEQLFLQWESEFGGPQATR